MTAIDTNRTYWKLEFVAGFFCLRRENKEEEAGEKIHNESKA